MSAAAIVAAIEAYLEDNTLAIKSYKINGREIQRYSMTELLQMLEYQKTQAAIASKGTTRTYVEFGS